MYFMNFLLLIFMTIINNNNNNNGVFQLTGSGGCGPRLELALRPAETESVHEPESAITQKLSLGDENVPDPHRKHDPVVLAHVHVSNIFIGVGDHKNFLQNSSQMTIITINELIFSFVDCYSYHLSFSIQFVLL